MKAKSSTPNCSVPTTPTTQNGAEELDCDVSVCFGGKEYSKSGKTPTTDAKTVSSKKSVASLCTFNGKQFGGANKPDSKYPVLATELTGFLDGNGVLTACDGWMDKEGNDRSSVRLYVSPLLLAAADEKIVMRTSTQKGKENVLIIQFKVSKEFTVPDLALSYMLERIKEHYGCSNEVAQQLLHFHPRFAAMTQLIKSRTKKAFEINEDEDFICEVRVSAYDRIGKPMPIADELVTAEEDPVFYGFHAEQSDCGGTNVYLEFKRSDRKFAKVTYDLAEAEEATFYLGSHKLPKNVFTKSPAAHRFRTSVIHEGDDEDNSSIESEESFHSADLKTPTPKKARVHAEDVDDDDDDVDAVSVKLRGLNMKELSRIAQAANDLMVERVIQTQLSTDDSKETPPKKKKGAQGSASVSGSIGNATRGSADREAKRKVPRSDDDVTMASRRSIQSHRSSHTLTVLLTRTEAHALVLMLPLL